MGTISIRLNDDILEHTKSQAVALDIPRAEYIRRAIVAMNTAVARDLRRKKIMEASKRVRRESMRINSEFAAIEDDPNG